MFKISQFIQLMGSIQITFTIDGLESALAKKEDILSVGDVIFYSDGEHKYAKTVVDSKDPTEAGIKARDLVSRSLSKAIFAFNTEASISNIGYSFIDYNHEPPQSGGVNGILTIFSVGLVDPKTTLTKISQVKPEKKNIIDLALAYYRLCYYDNPLKLQTLYSSMSVIARDIRKKKFDDRIETWELRSTLYDILQKEDRSFCKETFEKEWKMCYSERNNMTHGGESKLVDAENEDKHLDIVSKVGYWTLTVLNHYIEMNQRV
jgi:hypothetical protein